MRRSCWLGMFLLPALLAEADPVSELDYQGKILVSNIAHHGSGYFKFAIANAGSGTNYWAHDGATSGEPPTHLTNAVNHGVFSVILGQAPMYAIDPAIFNNGQDLYLRVWFSTSTAGFSELLPAQKIVSSAYAINAGRVGGWTAEAVQSNAVAQATNSVTLAGDILGAPHANAIAAGAIVDVDVHAAAGIQGSKLQAASATNAGAVQFAAGAAVPLRAVDDSDALLHAFGVVNALTAAAPNSALAIVGAGRISVSNIGPATVQISGGVLPDLQNVIWVATNGSAAGPGSIDRPFDTPQNGYSAAAARYPGAPSVLVLGGGSYGASGLAMTSGSVHVQGLARPQIAALSISAPAAGLAGKQRVENLIVTGAATIGGGAAMVKLRDVRVNGGCTAGGTGIEFQNCQFRRAPGAGSALDIGPLGAAAEIGVYQCSVQNSDPAAAALVVGMMVADLEVIGCEIVNDNGATGPAITDLTPATAVLHYYGHNYIKGPLPTVPGTLAVADPLAGGAGPTIVFNHNVVYGNVGTAPGVAPPAHLQFFANNTIYGVINFAGGAAGWFQAGAPIPPDAANNTEDLTPAPPALPDHWDD